MSRVISLLVGLYTGIVIDQNFQVPRMPTIPLDYFKKLAGSDTSDSKKK